MSNNEHIRGASDADHFVVHDPGPLTTVQDLGRPGHAAWGVPPSGASDSAALTLANRLIGNREDSAGLEITFGGLVGTFSTGRNIALTGAESDAYLDQAAIAFNTPYYARPGQTLRLGRPRRGLRTYLATSGGLATPTVLGSRSTDLMSGLGPPRLQAGQRLPLGPPTDAWPTVDLAPVAAPSSSPVLDIMPGPREDWFTADAMNRLTKATYTVTSEANRIGTRLHGPTLTRANTSELPAEGIPTGGLQVPPSGQPILLLTDHPVTGGYPVIAVVVTPSLQLAAQLTPGDTVRFRRSRRHIHLDP